MLFLTMQTLLRKNTCKCMYVCMCAYIKKTNIRLKDVTKINPLQNFPQELQKEGYDSVEHIN